MNEIISTREDEFLEISDAVLGDVNGGLLPAAAVGIFFAAAAVGYMMGADWAKQDK